MDSERVNQDSNQKNETYDAWQKMANEVAPQSSEKSEIPNNYNPDDWVGFETRIKNPEEKAAFEKNIGQLDKRTQEYLRELPGNIDCIFGVNEKSYEMLNKVLSKIIDKTISGSYNQGERNGKNFNLYIDDNGALYNGVQAGDARENDAAKNPEVEEKFEDAWAGWFPKTDGSEIAFTKSMQKLDKRTQEYLRNLPGNIDCIFGVNEESRALANEVQNRIIVSTLHGKYAPSETYKGENWNLYLTNDGGLYSGTQAADYRKKDNSASNSKPQPPITQNTETTQTIDTKTPEDFGFRDW